MNCELTSLHCLSSSSPSPSSSIHTPYTPHTHIYYLSLSLSLSLLQGIGTFSTVTRVTIMENQQQHQQQHQHHTVLPSLSSRRYYACKAVKQELCTTTHNSSGLCPANSIEGYVNAAAQLAYEAHILSSLDHPNIIKIRGLNITGLRTGTGTGGSGGGGGTGAEVGGVGQHLFLLTDVLPETLNQRIDRWKQQRRRRRGSNTTRPTRRRSSNIKATTPDSSLQLRQQQQQQQLHLEKYQICLQLASALAYVHSRHVVYRDLKPENIGFDRHGQLQLFDFGLCCELLPSIRPKATGIIGKYSTVSILVLRKSEKQK